MARAQGDYAAAPAAAEGCRVRQRPVRLRADPSRAISLRELMQRAGAARIEGKSLALPNLMKQRKYARATHSAVFAEVRVDEDLGTVHVTRVVSAVAAGRILNPKTAAARSWAAWSGASAWRCTRRRLHRPRASGRFMNHNLAEYHVAVNADVRDIEVIFVEEDDDVVNPLGVKGVGEIGIVGVAAAVANAIFHATGRRVRSLPITLDKVLGLD